MSQIADTPVKITKKKARKQIANTLEVALFEMKNGWSEKQFKNRIRKASKVLATGLSKKKAFSIPVISKHIILSTEIETLKTAE